MTPGEPLAFTWVVEGSPTGPLLRAELAAEARCLSSAVFGGGLGPVRTWVNLQVPPDYRRTDPESHLAAATAAFPKPVVGMLTAAAVEQVQDVTSGSARVLATVGLGHPTGAATLGPPTGAATLGPPAGAAGARVGTINIFATIGVPLTGAGLAGAVITAVEAKAQALAAAGVRAANAPGPATGTASDALAIACPAPGGRGDPSPFCGPATPQGAQLAVAVFEAVLRGCRGWRER
ncbi:MAG TPA: adenosylcobinamide amidohydrolase [Actinomycetota bacterium]|nr:adenosylcobinamide amidohydrolase [Actinomycetota bacterium]